MKQIEKYRDGLIRIMDGCRADCEDCQFSSLCEKFVGFEELVDYLLSDAPENLLSDDEYIILKNIDKKWKWIARDIDLFLCLYESKPTKGTNSWIKENGAYKSINFFNHLFLFVKWENEEPYEISKLIEAYEENKYGN